MDVSVAQPTFQEPLLLASLRGDFRANQTAALREAWLLSDAQANPYFTAWRSARRVCVSPLWTPAASAYCLKEYALDRKQWTFIGGKKKGAESQSNSNPRQENEVYLKNEEEKSNKNPLSPLCDKLDVFNGLPLFPRMY